MKRHVRTLGSIYMDLVPTVYGFVSIKRILWHDEYEKEIWRRYLNALGFYVTTGTGDSLDVFVLKDTTLIEDLKQWWRQL